MIKVQLNYNSSSNFHLILRFHHNNCEKCDQCRIQTSPEQLLKELPFRRGWKSVTEKGMFSIHPSLSVNLMQHLDTRY